MLISALLIATGIFMPSETADAASAGFVISGFNKPSYIKKGSSVTLKGTIRSGLSLSYVQVGVTDTKGKWVQGAYVKKNTTAKNFNLKKLSSKVSFKKLNDGTYYYRVVAKDKKGHKKQLMNKKFHVSSLKGVGMTKPKALYKGAGFNLKGTLRSGSRITKVQVGVLNQKSKWISSCNETVKPEATSFDLSRLDTRIPIRKLSAGTYYYCVRAQDKNSKFHTILKKKFTVSGFTKKNCNYPTQLATGSYYSLKGTINSKFKMTSVRAGVKTTSGKWVSGVNASAKPKKTSYRIDNLDSKIKFGKLQAGNYYYTIVCEDNKGIKKTVLKKKFTVGSGATTSAVTSSSDQGILRSNGKVLSYKANLISSTIGAQKVSGPCGIYAMAYCRAVMDGKFTKGSYSSVYSRLIGQYGHGTYAAHWYEAGGTSCYYPNSAKKCYQVALQQLANGKPCIINVYNSYSGNQHYVAVIGYLAGTTYDNVSLQSFIVLDPVYAAQKNLSNLPYKNNSTPQCITF